MTVDNIAMEKLVRFLKQLGLDDEQAQVYIYLLQNGAGTVLQISRGLKTGRTKLYPLLEQLADQQLITIHERHYGTSYEAQPPEALEFLVTERERKAENLRSNLPAAIHNLQLLRQDSPSSSRIVEYRGVDGLKQMNFNLTKADKEFRVFELSSLDRHLGSHFAEKMRQLYVEKGLRTFDITNNPKRNLGTDAITNPLGHIAYIDPKVFTIEFETYIYNNCVALLSYEADDIFGVEVYNSKLAAQQKQLFDLIWKLGKELKASADR